MSAETPVKHGFWAQIVPVLQVIYYFAECFYFVALVVITIPKQEENAKGRMGAEIELC